ncbi:hypothetical protein LWM68_27755 [Niabella sp. W65]|nr:hypothetical protein [Niabella sp. W65]MCH7366232.1 hypothetical protein [Niabella sp. W65]ULT46674.1 hypothetical protein KRR40_46705 [Niabella sp. I65]
MGNQKNILLQARQNGLGATAITIADNIIQGGAAAAVLSGPLKEGVWKNNWLYKVAGPGDIPAGDISWKMPGWLKIVRAFTGLAPKALQ